MSDQNSLSGRVTLVTGAGAGIGRAIALSLANAGAFVGLHCRLSVDGAKEALEAIQQRGANGMVLRADLSNVHEASEMVDKFVESAGRLDILVNNAGSPIERRKIEECPIELWRKVLDSNLTSAFAVTQRAIPHLRACRHGAIVNILSLSVQTGGANGAGPYAAAKGGLQVLTRTLAKELAPDVRVNAVMPGVIETRHHEVFSSPERMEQYRRETPLGRNGQADEVAEAVRFLASDAARFITGAVLDINGGRYMR